MRQSPLSPSPAGAPREEKATAAARCYTDVLGSSRNPTAASSTPPWPRTLSLQRSMSMQELSRSEVANTCAHDIIQKDIARLQITVGHRRHAMVMEMMLVGCWMEPTLQITVNHIVKNMSFELMSCTVYC